MRSTLILLTALAASPALADPCDDLWFTRNLIMDRAGYCFGSALGQAVFDNTGCTGKSVTLGRDDQRLVDALLEQEKMLGCKVDTGRRSLEIDDMPIRRHLRDLPVADEHESGCIGWRLGETRLYAGRGTSAGVIGRIEPGDDVLWSHYSVPDVPGWSYVTVHAPGWGKLKSAGWLGTPTDESSCHQWAG